MLYAEIHDSRLPTFTKPTWCKPAGTLVTCTILHIPAPRRRDSSRPFYPYLVVAHTERGPVLFVRPSQ